MPPRGLMLGTRDVPNRFAIVLASSAYKAAACYQYSPPGKTSDQVRGSLPEMDSRIDKLKRRYLDTVYFSISLPAL